MRDVLDMLRQAVLEVRGITALMEELAEAETDWGEVDYSELARRTSDRLFEAYRDLWPVYIELKARRKRAENG